MFKFSRAFSTAAAAAAKYEGIAEDVTKLIGTTPLVEVKSLSKLTGQRVLAKMEMFNPVGSVKDRPALFMFMDAERRGLLKPGSTIVEATGGNTGITLALLANQRGYKTILTMPETVSIDKVNYMRALGAEVLLQPIVPFSDPRQFSRRAMDIAENTPNCFFVNQFENPANHEAHYRTTGPEIYRQTAGEVDAFVVACGTAGTLSGVSRFIKEQAAQAGKPLPQCFLIDPPQGGTYAYLKGGCYEQRGTSISEGIGIMRKVYNFAVIEKHLDGTMTADDQDLVDVAYHVLKEDGLFVGPSGAVNLLGAIKTARILQKQAKEKGEDNKKPRTIVTVIPDSGERYKGTLWNSSVLKEKNLSPHPVKSMEQFEIDSLLPLKK